MFGKDAKVSSVIPVCGKCKVNGLDEKNNNIKLGSQVLFA